MFIVRNMNFFSRRETEEFISFLRMVVKEIRFSILPENGSLQSDRWHLDIRFPIEKWKENPLRCILIGSDVYFYIPNKIKSLSVFFFFSRTRKRGAGASWKTRGFLYYILNVFFSTKSDLGACWPRYPPEGRWGPGRRYIHKKKPIGQPETPRASSSTDGWSTLTFDTWVGRALSSSFLCCYLVETSPFLFLLFLVFFFIPFFVFLVFFIV